MIKKKKRNKNKQKKIKNKIKEEEDKKNNISDSESEEEYKEQEEDNNNDNNWNQFLLNPKLSKNLSHLFENPTNIQKKTLLYTNAKIDLIVQARTGEGKTLCYAVPVLNYIFNFYDKSPNMNKKNIPSGYNISTNT